MAVEKIKKGNKIRKKEEDILTMQKGDRCYRRA